MATRVVIKRGDLYPFLDAILTGMVETSPGVFEERPHPLNGATVRLRMRARGASVLTIDNALCTIVDANAGHVRYEWQPGDTNNRGEYIAEFPTVLANGLPATFPNGGGYVLVSITEDIIGA